VRVGVGGWTFEPWRGVFYPEKLSQKRELAHMGERLTACEINGTFYSLQKPESYAKWRDETPDGFVFALKGSRYIVNRRELAGAGEAMPRFFGSGMSELGSKLGPSSGSSHTPRSSIRTTSPGSWTCCRASWRACHCGTRWSRGTTASRTTGL
jgi:hypothetical protein